MSFDGTPKSNSETGGNIIAAATRDLVPATLEIANGQNIGNFRAVAPAEDGPDLSAQTVFQQQWHLYRKMVDNNYLFHREVYGCLHRILIDEMPRPFRFLVVGCGDARETVAALKGTRIESFVGIDLSRAALDLAEETLTALGCPVRLEQRDYFEALGERTELVDVVWIGLSLHHLVTAAKLTVLRTIREILSDRGLLIIYEPASPDAEDRAGWLRRWDRQQPSWTEFTQANWDLFVTHVRAADFPETATGWHELGLEAGFDEVREVFVAPTDLLRMYYFRA